MSEESDPTPFPGHKITFPKDGNGLGCSACGRRGYALSNPCPADTERRFVKCDECDGFGEWDEGPLNTSSSGGAVDPEYRQVICPKCQGTGKAEEEVYPVNMEDLELETTT